MQKIFVALLAASLVITPVTAKEPVKCTKGDGLVIALSFYAAMVSIWYLLERNKVRRLEAEKAKTADCKI